MTQTPGVELVFRHAHQARLAVTTLRGRLGTYQVEKLGRRVRVLAEMPHVETLVVALGWKTWLAAPPRPQPDLLRDSTPLEIPSTTHLSS